MTPDQEKRLLDLADREEIRELVLRERFARDQQHFDVMRDCFYPEGHVRTSWYDGSAEDYIPATRRSMEKSPGSKHWVFPGYVRIDGDRATVESPAMIFNRADLDGVIVDYHMFCRFFSRVERRDGTWRLLTFEVLWERDILRPVNPSETLPVDWDLLATFRHSYRFLTFMQERRGFNVNPDLYGDDRPDDLQRFHDGETRWLQGTID